MIVPGSMLVARNASTWLMLAPSTFAWRTTVPFSWGLCIATSSSQVFAEGRVKRTVDYAYVLDSLTMRLGWVYARDIAVYREPQ